MKIIISFLICLLIQPTHAGLEFQKKFKLSAIHTKKLSKDLDDSIVLKDYHTFKHATYEYIDVYLETDNDFLYQNKLSLRFRKRMYGNGVIAYGFQLKSEQEDPLQARMEIEEDDLAIYHILHDESFIPLIDILETYFTLSTTKISNEKRATLKSHNKLLNSWIIQKYNAAIAPFQKLRRLFPKNESELITLKPRYYGKSKRERIHLYIGNSEARSLNIPFEFKLKPKPVFFLNSPTRLWLMEASLDHSQFLSLIDFKRYDLSELEIEGKHPQEVIGQKVYQELKIILEKKYQVEENVDSKYRQTYIALKD